MAESFKTMSESPSTTHASVHGPRNALFGRSGIDGSMATGPTRPSCSINPTHPAKIVDSRQLMKEDTESTCESPPDTAHSCFLKLSGELRTQVYDLLLESMPCTIYVPLSQERLRKQYSAASLETAEKIVHVLKTAQTCRTVRKELLAMFYGARTFTAQGMYNLRSLLEPLRPDALAMLQDVRITFLVVGDDFRTKSPHKTLWYVHDKYGKGALRMEKVKVTLLVRHDNGEDTRHLVSLDQLDDYEAVHDPDGWVISLKEGVASETALGGG